MKRFTYLWLRSFILLFFSILSFVAWAQTDSGSSERTTTTTTETTTVRVETTDNWYTQSWVWVIGGAAFILLLVALLSRRGSSTVNSERITIKRKPGTE